MLSALRGLLIDMTWTFSLPAPATVPACLDRTRGGLSRWPARWPVPGFVPQASEQKYANFSNVGMYAVSEYFSCYDTRGTEVATDCCRAGLCPHSIRHRRPVVGHVAYRRQLGLVTYLKWTQTARDVT